MDQDFDLYDSGDNAHDPSCCCCCGTPATFDEAEAAFEPVAAAPAFEPIDVPVEAAPVAAAPAFEPVVSPPEAPAPEPAPVATTEHTSTSAIPAYNLTPGVAFSSPTIALDPTPGESTEEIIVRQIVTNQQLSQLARSERNLNDVMSPLFKPGDEFDRDSIFFRDRS